MPVLYSFSASFHTFFTRSHLHEWTGRLKILVSSKTFFVLAWFFFFRFLSSRCHELQLQIFIFSFPSPILGVLIALNGFFGFLIVPKVFIFLFALILIFNCCFFGYDSFDTTHTLHHFDVCVSKNNVFYLSAALLKTLQTIATEQIHLSLFF